MALDIKRYTLCINQYQASFRIQEKELLEIIMQSITFEASDRSRSLSLTLIHSLASDLSLAPIREIARYKTYSI